MSTQKVVAVLCLLCSPALSHLLNNRNLNYTQVRALKRQERSTSWEYFPLLPLDIHDHDIETEQLPGSAKTERDVHTPEFRSLCQTLRRRVELREIYGADYEYRPPHFYESTCKGPSERSPDLAPVPANNNLMCVYPGFSCVQRSQTLYMTRRKYDSNCWETFTRNVASNCECMWPVQTLGEVARH